MQLEINMTLNLYNKVNSNTSMERVPHNDAHTRGTTPISVAKLSLGTSPVPPNGHRNKRTEGPPSPDQVLQIYTREPPLHGQTHMLKHMAQNDTLTPQATMK
jgi:hypothetical protein